ncbi:MAG: hypothetical protein HY901_25145 [Deltaproteobacteria bacterium]|nr:hypothetical protein [Deltaproteobacteria bacterium]
MSPRPAYSIRRTLGAAAAAVVVLSGCGDCGDGRPSPPPQNQASAAVALAHLVVVEGAATLTRAGKTEPASPGPLLKDDALATGPQSRVVLRFKNGREVEVGEGARFIISEGAGEMSLEIAEGQVISRVGAQKGEAGAGVALAILTPYGISRVPSGGEATVAVALGGVTTIEVKTGQITFVGKDGTQRTAQSGDKLEIALGEVKISRGSEVAGAPDAGPGPATVQLEAIVVRLSADRGNLQVKGVSEDRFRKVARGAEADLAEGAVFRIAPGGRGTLAGPGLRVRLGGGTEGRLGKATREAGAERYELGLSKGLSQIFIEGEGKRVVTLPAHKGQVEVSAEGGATFTWSRDARSARAEVQAGKVELSFEGETREVLAGQVAEMGKGLAVTGKARPLLVLPAGRRVRVFSSGNGNALREVGLSWPSSEEGRTVEVASDPAFKELLLRGAVTGTMLVVAAPAMGELHWRVLGAGPEPISRGQARFAPEKMVETVGGHPVNEVSETGLKATVYYQSVLPALVFAYPAVDGAAKYQVRVFRADDLKTPLVDKTVAERRCAADPGKLREGSYLWNATPLGPGGAELAGGRMNKLDIVYDNAMVSLTIQQPQRGEAVTGGEVLTRGVAPLGSKLFVNGQPAPLGNQGRFELRVPRASTLVYRLVSSDMVESYWLRSLRAR